MASHVVKTHAKQHGSSRGLSVLLLLPLMCAVIFFASQLGTIDFAAGLIERQVTPFQTADYAPWNDIIFAPVDDALLTQIALDNSGGAATYSGIATARPTIERQPPVGIPAIIAQNQTRVSPNSVVDTSSGTSVAQAADASDSPTDDVTDETSETATVSDAETDTPEPTETDTPEPTETDTTEPTDTDTPNPTNTRTPIPSETNTPIPTNTNTAIPTNTTVPAPSINFGASPQTGSAPLTVNFTNLSSGNITSYRWNFGDGTTSSAASISHTYNTPGSYYVSFTITGPGGSAAAGVTITVNAAQTATPVPPPPPTSNPDTDGDSIPNGQDQCPNQGDIGYGLLGNGCPFIPNDSDNDGVYDPSDSCPFVGNQGYGLNANGCPVPAPDSDGDGYRDNVDACPAQGNQGYGVDSTGCPNPVPDTDGDGYADNVDSCPTQGDQGYGVDSTGCPNPIPDSDGDGYLDNVDACPTQGDQGYGVDGTGCPNPPPPSFSVTSVILVDAVADVDIRPLASVDTITLSGNNRTLRATVSGGVNSVVFRINGSEVRTENIAPYAIAGDVGGTDFAIWNYPPGTYTLTVTPYDSSGGGGNAGNAITITLTITP